MRAHLQLFSATFFWGANFHLGKFALMGFAYVQSGFVRYCIALILLTFLFRVSWKALVARLKEQPVGILLIGLALAGFNVFFFLGLQSSSVLNASLIVSLNPLFTLLLSIPILGQRLSGTALLGVVISLVGGVVLISRADWGVLSAFEFQTGELIITLAYFCFALHHVLVRKYISAESSRTSAMLTSWVCWAVLLFMLPITGEGLPPIVVPFEAVLGILGMGVFGTALSYYWFSLGVSRLGASAAAAYMNNVPFSAAAIAVLRGEPLLTYHLVSACLIAVGVFLILRRPRVVRIHVHDS